MKRKPPPAVECKFGEVMPGWSRRSWADHLRLMASRCDERHKEIAARYVSWADSLDKATQENVSDSDSL